MEYAAVPTSAIPPQPAPTPPRVAVLALQGDFAAHAAAAAALGLAPREVRTAAELHRLNPAGLILPGGESTAMLRLLADTGLAEAVAAAVGAGVPTLATCAGTILLAREVRGPAQPSLGLLDVVVERNAYGRQLASAVLPVRVAPGWGAPGPTMEAVFIRAPRILHTGPAVEVLAWRGEDPVLVRQGPVLAATFHPELSTASPVLELFSRLVAARAASLSPH